MSHPADSRDHADTAVIAGPHLTPYERETLVAKLLPMLRDYGTQGLEEATKEATKRYVQEG